MMLDTEEALSHTMELDPVAQGFYFAIMLRMWGQPYARLRNDDDVLWRAAGKPDKRTWRHALPEIRRLLVPVGNDAAYVTMLEARNAHRRFSKYVNAPGKSAAVSGLKNHDNVVTYTNTNTFTKKQPQ